MEIPKRPPYGSRSNRTGRLRICPRAKRGDAYPRGHRSDGDRYRKSDSNQSSIYAGCKVLLSSVGLSFKDLEQFIIAGGFGRHLDLEKAIFIGLLPEIDIEKFLFVGNGSLLGARLLSFSKNLLREAERIA